MSKGGNVRGFGVPGPGFDEPLNVGPSRSAKLRIVRNRTTSGFLVLVALALSVLLAQPICEAHEADVADSVACCVSIAEAALGDFDSAAPVPATKPSLVVTLAEAPSPAWRASARDRAALAPPGRPLVSLPYHVRSARILS